MTKETLKQIFSRNVLAVLKFRGSSVRSLANTGLVSITTANRASCEHNLTLDNIEAICQVLRIAPPIMLDESMTIDAAGRVRTSSVGAVLIQDAPDEYALLLKQNKKLTELIKISAKLDNRSVEDVIRHAKALIALGEQVQQPTKGAASE
jgi:hypothetical protein